MTPNQVFETILDNNPVQAAGLQSALMMLSMIDPDLIRDAINRINRAETIGPLMDPTAWMDGDKFKGAQFWKDLLTDLLPVVKRLKELKGDT